MARKRSEINEHQGSLMQQVSDVVMVGETFPEDPREKIRGHDQEPEIVYGPPGSYVDLRLRAEFLSEALRNIGLRNQRLGFDVASNTRQYDAPIWARYRSRVPRVQEGASANVDRFGQKAKEAFWAATGYSALREAGIAPREEIDAGARKMWRKFTDKYEAAGKSEKRHDYERQLKRYTKTTERILKKAAA